MKSQRHPILTGVVIALQGMLALPCVAQQTNETERLLDIIGQQQQRLDAQQAQLEQQKQVLQELRKEVETHQGAGPAGATTATASTSATAPVPSGSTGPKNKGSFPGLEKATQAAVAAKEAWPGSFEVDAINTRFKISGFVELDVMHDTDAILTPSAFVTKAIVTGNSTPSQGSDGQTHFSIQPTRLALETRTPLDDHQLTTFISIDFFNDFGSTTPELRLREAYAELSNLLLGGDLLLGQTWSTYANLYAIPNVLDFQTPNAVFGTRHPMLRWTRALGAGWTVKLAAEAPDVRQFENASTASQWPDGAAALGWANDSVNVMGSFVARDLRAEGDTTGQLVSTFGWAASLAGRVHMPGALKQDFATFSVTYGEGFGGILNDIAADATYNPATGQFGAIPTLAWFVGYQHWWNPKFYSVISYGDVWQDNLDYQAATAYLRTHYSSVNLTWTPSPHWLFGIEGLYGTRQDNNGEAGHVFRAQLTSRFMF